MNGRTNKHVSGKPSILRACRAPGPFRKHIAPFFLLLTFCLLPSSFCLAAPLVLQSDFGTKDGAVAEMKGVATSVDAQLKIYDLTHEIPAFNIWEGAYRLWQTAPYWPAGTVFVSVVDPGVGTTRKSVVARAKNGQYFVTPDNGRLTLVAENLGLEAVREIDEKVNRRPGSEDSFTFHGRDVYAYTGARLAAGVIKFEEVGPELELAKLVTIPHEPVFVYPDKGYVTGSVPVLDPQYGNVWTDVSQADFSKLNPQVGEKFRVLIFEPMSGYLKFLGTAHLKGDDYLGKAKARQIFEGMIPYENSFGNVPEGRPLLYINSLGNVSVAINEGNFAAAHKVKSGPGWAVWIQRLPK